MHWMISREHSLFVSHDRYFINRIATKVIDISVRRRVEYLGDYDYFVEKKLEQQELDAENGTRPNNYTSIFKARRTKTIRNCKDKNEDSLGQLTNWRRGCPFWMRKWQHFKMNYRYPEFADDHVKLMELQAQIDELQVEHDCKSEEWLLLQEQLNHYEHNYASACLRPLDTRIESNLTIQCDFVVFTMSKILLAKSTHNTPVEITFHNLIHMTNTGIITICTMLSTLSTDISFFYSHSYPYIICYYIHN